MIIEQACDLQQVQIRSVSNLISYLQSVSGVPVLGQGSSLGQFAIVGAIQLLSSPSLYLNVASSSVRTRL